ncbi:MAG: hypothetical protein WC878_08115 [Candidatus Paceibacterota bacterium]
MKNWSWKKCAAVGGNFGIVACILVGAFWFVWSLCAPVPILTVDFHGLPFAISRYAEAAVAAIFILVAVTAYGRTRKYGFLNFFGFVFGVSCGLAFGWGAEFIFGWLFGLVAGLLFSCCVVDSEQNFGFVSVLIFIFVYCLSYGMVSAIDHALFYGLFFPFIIIARFIKPFWILLLEEEKE